LRRLGLSQTKAGTLREVARLADVGAFDDLDSLSDDDVSGRLTAIKGIGPWTAHMVLMFALGRPDVWPVGDVGIQRAARELYDADGRDALENLGERFRPYRSHAAWYLWRSLGGGKQ
jgi:DNA-3-methyladenine glycosylase II